MKNNDIDNFVHKFIKKGSEVISLSDIVRERVPDYDILDGRCPQEVYRFSSQLQRQGRVRVIKQWLFLILWDHNSAMSIVDIYDRYYWQIARAVIRDECGGDYVLWWNKPLEFLLRDMSTPPTLVVYTRSTKKDISLGNGYKISFRTIARSMDSWESWRSKKAKNLFPTLKKYSELIKFDSCEFRIPLQEIALLEALTERVSGELGTLLVEKFLKRPFIINEEILRDASEWRYIQAINRLRILSKKHKKHDLYEITLDLIARNGGWVFLPY